MLAVMDSSQDQHNKTKYFIYNNNNRINILHLYTHINN